MKKIFFICLAVLAVAACSKGGTDPQPTGDFQEHLDAAEPYFTYYGVNYKVVKLKDGRWWMAQNLAYLPKGYTPCDKLDSVTAGVYYPVISNGSAAVFSTDSASIADRGYLYQSEVALGLAVNSIKTEADAQALNKAQGICPPGWYIPDTTDLKNLIGKLVSPIETKTNAPYYNGTNGSISMLNADGMNMDAYGAVTVQDNTKTAATLMGYLKGYPNKTTSGYFCGSSFAGITYSEGTTIKNVQFFGLMPMTNKATAAEYTCNGAKLSYKIAASVRCIRKVQ